MMSAETRLRQGHRLWQSLCKTLIRKVAKAFQGNPGMSEPSFSINSLISRIQTQFYRSLYRGLLIEGSVTGLHFSNLDDIYRNVRVIASRFIASDRKYPPSLARNGSQVRMAHVSTSSNLPQASSGGRRHCGSILNVIIIVRFSCDPSQQILTRNLI